MPCDEVGYQQYWAEVASRVSTERLPLHAIIELTERCNLQCQHCYIHDPAQHARVRAKELNTRQWFGIFDELAEAGCLWMTWTGGEILLRPDFAELYRYAKRKGFLIVLFTNGTLLTPGLVELLQVWYPQYVEISMYGITAETYEKVTGVKGAFARCIWGIEALVEARIPLRLKTVGMTLNKRELSAMYDYAADLSLQFRHDATLRPTFHGHDIGDLRLPADEVVDLDFVRPDGEDMLRTAYDQAMVAVKDNPLYDPERLYNCGAGFRSFHIDPYGQLTLCHMIRTPGYDLTTGTFAQGWGGFLGQMRSMAVRKKDLACLHCDLLGLCARCPAFSSLENDDPESVVEYACAIAHARAERIGVTVQN